MADTHVAASCSYADVMTAYGLCVAGDTLSVPAGSATWDYRWEITIPIYVVGAGIGQTIITSNYHPTDTTRLKTNRLNYLVTYYPSNPSTTEDSRFRFSGFTLNLNASSFGFILYNPTVYNQKYMRFDHNRVYNAWGRSAAIAYGGRTFFINGSFCGVADNNDIGEITGTYISVDGVNSTWTTAGGVFDYGSANMFYFEDNTLYGFGSLYMLISSEKAARFCVRHNAWDGTGLTSGLYPMFDAHGNQPNAITATMGVEIYENDIYCPFPMTFFDQRGGKALVYNNRITGGSSSLAGKLREEYNDNLGLGPEFGPNGQPQHVSESYYWNNTRNGVISSGPSITETVDYGGSIGLVPQFDVDVWKQVTPFTGASGVGVGTLVQRPTSGLTVGVGYWATDTQTLYRATSATAWQAYYTPYAYPHPLREEAYPEPGTPTVLVTSSASILHAATSPVLVPEVDYILGVADATLALDADYLTVTPIEPTPWEIRLGVLGGEELLPPLNWPSGSSPEMPEGTTAYVDSVALADGSVRHNFRTYSPRKWTHEWAQLTAAQVGVFNELVAHAVPLHYQNKWVNADWHWVIITACDPVPLTTTFTTGTPFWKLTLELEEIL
jgi:hypothetical protein